MKMDETGERADEIMPEQDDWDYWTWTRESVPTFRSDMVDVYNVEPLDAEGEAWAKHAITGIAP